MIKEEKLRSRQRGTTTEESKVTEEETISWGEAFNQVFKIHPFALLLSLQ